jgi:hypothetical protein
MTAAVNIPPDLAETPATIAAEQGTMLAHPATKCLRAGHDLLYDEGNSLSRVLLADNPRLIKAYEHLQGAYAALVNRHEHLVVFAFRGTIVSVEEKSFDNNYYANDVNGEIHRNAQSPLHNENDQSESSETPALCRSPSNDRAEVGEGFAATKYFTDEARRRAGVGQETEPLRPIRSRPGPSRA